MRGDPFNVYVNGDSPDSICHLCGVTPCSKQKILSHQERRSRLMSMLMETRLTQFVVFAASTPCKKQKILSRHEWRSHLMSMSIKNSPDSICCLRGVTSMQQAQNIVSSEKKIQLKFHVNPSFTKGGGGEGGSSRPVKGFSLITFEQNNLETSNFA